jgi:hypothetical protein
LKSALVGVPIAVCANCAVPTACGVTRGHGRVEVALLSVQFTELQPGRYDDDLYGPAVGNEPHVKAFDITGKPIKNWILVEPEGVEAEDQLKDWIQRAVRFVGKLPRK